MGTVVYYFVMLFIPGSFGIYFEMNKVDYLIFVVSSILWTLGTCTKN